MACLKQLVKVPLDKDLFTISLMTGKSCLVQAFKSHDGSGLDSQCLFGDSLIKRSTNSSETRSNKLRCRPLYDTSSE